MLKHLVYKEFLEMLKKIETLCETKEGVDKILAASIPRFCHIPDMNWPVEKEYFLKLIVESICRKHGISENKYDWIAEKHLGVGVFWSADDIWEWLQMPKGNYILKSDAEILFKNAVNFCNQKIAA